jgi:hypothetical protein
LSFLIVVICITKNARIFAGNTAAPVAFGPPAVAYTLVRGWMSYSPHCVIRERIARIGSGVLSEADLARLDESLSANEQSIDHPARIRALGLSWMVSA